MLVKKMGPASTRPVSAPPPGATIPSPRPRVQGISVIFTASGTQHKHYAPLEVLNREAPCLFFGDEARPSLIILTYRGYVTRDLLFVGASIPPDNLQFDGSASFPFPRASLYLMEERGKGNHLAESAVWFCGFQCLSK